MAWRETDRAKAVLIRRTYRCTDCKYEFKWTHASVDEPAPDCPMCAERGAAPPPVEWQPPLVAITGDKSRAIDMAQKVAEEQFGLTDMNDNQRAGDIAFKPPPPMQTAEAEAMARELIQAGIPEETTKEIQQAAQNFWQGDAGAASTDATIGNNAVAAQASAAARAAGVEPLRILEESGKRRSMSPHRGYSVAAAVSDSLDA